MLFKHLYVNFQSNFTPHYDPYFHFLCRFQQLVLETQRQCRFDSVSVYEGHSSDQENLVARFCGDHTSDLPVVTTRGNMAQVVFKSDHSYTREGFWASLEFTYGKLVSLQLTYGNCPR